MGPTGGMVDSRGEDTRQCGRAQLPHEGEEACHMAPPRILPRPARLVALVVLDALVLHLQQERGSYFSVRTTSSYRCCGTVSILLGRLTARTQAW